MTDESIPGIATMERLHFAAEGHRQCLLGYHAWVPWLTTIDGTGHIISWRTWCARQGCDHVEQWDV